MFIVVVQKAVCSCPKSLSLSRLTLLREIQLPPFPSLLFLSLGLKLAIDNQQLQAAQLEGRGEAPQQKHAQELLQSLADVYWHVCIVSKRNDSESTGVLDWEVEPGTMVPLF